MKKSKIFLSVLILSAAFVMGYLISDITIDIGNQAAVIPIKGTISPGAVQASPSSVQNLVEKAEKDGAEAYLFQINSPGGTVVSSRQVGKIVERIDKPTVCQLQDIAASGAYWIASACDKIVADPLTVTGSIGVSASYLEYSEYLEEEGIEYVRLVKGDLKDMGSPYKNITQREREFFNQSLTKVHEHFKQEVMENRPIDEEEIDEISSGRTFIGSVAKEKGLVDRLGGREEAKKILTEKVGTEIKFKNYRNNLGSLSLLDLINKKGEDMNVDSDTNSLSLNMNFPRILAVYF